MAIKYGEIRRSTLKLLDDYSSRGNVLAPIKVADYNFKIQQVCNESIMELASTTAKLPKTLLIPHNPIKNSLYDDTSSIRQHIPSIDFSIALQGARSCFFEATRFGEIILEESSDGINYTNIETITVPSNTEGFAEYRRLITPSLLTNTVRLRFTGEFPYSFRNYVLYVNSWPTEDDVEQHRPWWVVENPSDYLDFNYAEAKDNYGQYVPYSNIVKDPEGKLSFWSYDGPMELLLYYWRKPTLLTFTDVQSVDDELVIDLRDDAALILPYNIAGTIQNSEEPNRGDGYLKEYTRKSSRLIQITPTTTSKGNLYKW